MWQRPVGCPYGTKELPVVRERSARLLEVFGLADAGRKAVKTYSGGMRRKLDLALSLIAEPPILFLDEPTAALDPASRHALWDIIRGMVGGARRCC